MARVVIHTAKGPKVHQTPKGDVVAICMCGLSKDYPFCDGSHQKTSDEEERIYLVDQEGARLGTIDLDSRVRRV